MRVIWIITQITLYMPTSPRFHQFFRTKFLLLKGAMQKKWDVLCAQLKGILATIVIAIIAGLFTGKVVSLFGQPIKIYDDETEFETEDSE